MTPAREIRLLFLAVRAVIIMFFLAFFATASLATILTKRLELLWLAALCFLAALLLTRDFHHALDKYEEDYTWTRTRPRLTPSSPPLPNPDHQAVLPTK